MNIRYILRKFSVIYLIIPLSLNNIYIYEQLFKWMYNNGGNLLYIKQIFISNCQDSRNDDLHPKHPFYNCVYPLKTKEISIRNLFYYLKLCSGVRKKNHNKIMSGAVVTCVETTTTIPFVCDERNKYYEPTFSNLLENLSKEFEMDVITIRDKNIVHQCINTPFYTLPPPLPERYIESEKEKGDNEMVFDDDFLGIFLCEEECQSVCSF